MVLHGLVGLRDEGLGVRSHIAEPSQPLKVFRILLPKVLEVLVRRLVVRIHHPDSSGVDQLRGEGLNLVQQKTFFFYSVYSSKTLYVLEKTALV